MLMTFFCRISSVSTLVPDIWINFKIADFRRLLVSFGVFGHVGNSAAGSSWYSKKWEFDRERWVRSRQFVLERPISLDVLEMLDVSFATEWKK
ncbi:hypothetical protein RCL_jg16928.t1 [Rhizophagus clarus]|uniref:Uncharacterized protein n=1 Tax=Rhizophagus clarus TaxID=94130 RepID=A0A8H3LAX6_9GLOM|nr:hypothetical protein RCL_jg16928.t1 [Rhizophagus clarus]